ncbi:DUF4864 domain-containing protein [Amaricoccus solimangrovi]|uniref:DUF4864 domain-containing protein n=1 Tax=Amaricoccus solimangrovi TaxID=2589815 RepID=A0A501WNM3_9RHOB|nr:DUF4864 domain-containing protein [Amaricoccus solimangrovi]TPE49940.1 DUF4864 domain-containing protein [Amaricoccus solimangrovi]
MRFRATIAVIAGSLGLGGGKAPPDETVEIRAVISDLVRAVRAGDARGADRLVSRQARRESGGPRTFARATLDAHPELRSDSAVQFAGIAESGRQRLQSALITDGAGALHFVDWQMVRDGDRWVVNAIQFRAATEARAAPEAVRS